MTEPIPTEAELWRQAERLRALARTLIADPGLGEDVVQDAWVAALRRPAAARAGPGAWLAGAVRNLARRARQREGERAAVERLAARGEAQEGPEEAVARAELQQRLGAAVLALAEPCRSAVILRHFDRLDPGEIARRQGCSREAARQRIARGLEQLRARLDAEHGGRERWCLAFAALVRTPVGAPPAPSLAATAGGLVMTSKWILGSAGLTALVALLWVTRGVEREAAPESAVIEATEAQLAPPPSDGPPTSEQGERSAVAAAGGSQVPPAPLGSPPEALRGRVIDRNGSPIEGAWVGLLRPELRGFTVLDLLVAHSPETMAGQLSGPDGSFSFELDAGLSVDVCAVKAGYCASTLLDRHAGQTLAVVLGPGYRLSGRVTRETDRLAVAGAVVRAFQSGGYSWAHQQEVRTGDDGRYELRLPVGQDVRVDVLPLVEQARGGLRAEFDASGEARLDIEVLEGLVVEGHVRNADTGQPIDGAVVGEGWTFSRTAVTDASGAYRLTGFGRDGVYQLYARAKGFGQTADSPGIVDARRRRLDFALWPAHTATGRLVDASGAPVSDAYVAAIGKDASELDWSSARSDADGRFRCEDLGPGPRHALLVHHPRFATVVYDFPPEERLTPDLGEIVLRAPGLIAGRVRDAQGRGIAGARVELSGTNRDRYALIPDPSPIPDEVAEPYVSQREAFTDEEGRFWFGQVAEGDYRLATRPAGRAPLEGVALVLGPGERKTDVELVLPAGASLRGRLADEDGVGLAGVLVHVRHESGERGESVRTSVRSAPDGSFELHDLASGAYSLEVMPFLPWTGLPADGEPWLYSSLEHVPTDAAPVLLTVRRGTSIQGMLRNVAGEPLHGYQLSIRDADGNHGLGTSTDSEGRFTLGVEPGTTWTIEVSGPDGEAGFRTLLVRAGIPAGTRDLELRLAR